MRKRGARFNTTRGHVLTPDQVQRLVMPIHVALELLPLGLFSEDHAHDLAAFLNVAQLAAKDAKRADIHNEVLAGVEVLAAMHDRARTGKSWNVTSDERETLTRTVTVLDRWYRTQPNSRWKRALYQVLVICDRATAKGVSVMDTIEVAA